MAIGIIIGAAFGKIVSSFVADLLMPPLSMLMGKVDFTNWFVTLSGGDFATLKAAKDAGAVTLNYGAFINAVIDFVIVAFAIFLLVKQINRLKKEAPPPPAAPPAEEGCWRRFATCSPSGSDRAETTHGLRRMRIRVIRG